MATDWTEQATQMFKFWTEGQKAWLESLARPAAGTVNPFGQATPPQAAMQQWNDAWKASLDQWSALLQQGSQIAFSQENLRKIVDPAEWAKPAPGSFDFGIEHLIEGPNFATLWDLDRKMLKLQQLGVKRAEDSAAYHAVVFAAWKEAAERFVRQFGKAEGTPVSSYRELVDLWIKTANETLLEVHRSPEFLEAQRRVTRSATDYRLAEREIAETYCEIHHLPTRTEMDEVQRTVYQLRRDLRALLRKLESANGAGTPAKAPRVRRTVQRKSKQSE
jgi:poly[(R)-3-hydroxyalkanoate] polymerase subunit PhaE